MKKLGLLMLGLGLIMSISSCKDSFVTWDLIIVNNTTNALDIYERTGAGNYHFVETVAAGTSVKEKGNLWELDFTFQARLSDGTVVSEFSYKQTELKHTEQTWTIN